MPPGGIRTHNPSKRAAADLRLRPRGHWDRHTIVIGFNNLFSFLMGPIGCLDTSVRNCHFLLHSNAEESCSLFMCYVVVCKVKNVVYKVILFLICVIFFNSGEKFSGKWGRVLNYNICQRRKQECSYVETGASKM